MGHLQMSNQTQQPQRCQWQFQGPFTREVLGCDKPSLPGSPYCLCHKPEKTPDEVKRFTQVVVKQMEEGNFNFAGYCFPPGWSHFCGRELREAVFTAASFEGSASFVGTTFESSGKYSVAANFAYGRFEGNADFTGVTVKGWAFFAKVHFGRRAKFWLAHFQGNADFQYARFGGKADFSSARFDGRAVFLGAYFLKTVDLHLAVFSDITAWQGAVFQGQGDFEAVGQLPPGRFIIGLPRADRGRAGRETRFALPATGEQLCRLAKETAVRTGNYRLAGEYFYYERKYADLSLFPWALFAWRRFQYRRKRWALPRTLIGPDGMPVIPLAELEKAWLQPQIGQKLSWRDKLRGLLGLILGWAVFGYGERPLRVFGWSVAVVLIWTFIYWGFGLVQVDESGIPVASLGRCLYFSTVTFTTLGFGDFTPLKTFWGMLLAALEAFLGMFMIALFVVSVAKRFARG